MSKKVNVIGIGGVARAGKDTLAQCIKEIIQEEDPSLRVEIRSFAAPLKKDLAEFILDKYGIDVFTTKDEEKLIIRPLLVAHGGAKRAQSQGTYWTGLMDVEIEKLAEQGVDYVIVPDVRYCDYETDEMFWIKKHDGVLFHVEKINDDGQVQPPANEDERRNDPLVREHAKVKITWPSKSFEACKETARGFKSQYIKE